MISHLSSRVQMNSHAFLQEDDCIITFSLFTRSFEAPLGRHYYVCGIGGRRTKESTAWGTHSTRPEVCGDGKYLSVIKNVVIGTSKISPEQTW